jgi:hypothetical protein
VGQITLKFEWYENLCSISKKAKFDGYDLEFSENVAGKYFGFFYVNNIS